jgi:hypothetical protein
MSKSASERLLERVKELQQDPFGVSCEDIARLSLDDGMIGDILECLSDPKDVPELKWGLWFTLGILKSNPPQSFLKWLVPRIPTWLKHRDGGVREGALEIFVPLRKNYKNYKKLMIGLLQDPSPVVRGRAVREYKTFLAGEDIPMLLHFKNDKYMTETEMGGPLLYAIRNDALAAIEALCGRQFTKSEKVEPSEADKMVYWWDWQPFLDSWNEKQNKWRFFNAM